ncbi:MULTISPECIES: glycosyl transferase [Microbacterium]|uniref:glycosyl transferase n=1 Tax=Microbacterium TaxID=33882 RepID=UPI00148500A2|nr:glycosyl transferase [Microbacterium sp. 4NA327F11]MCK9916816.1 glycosyl transferase [Microbacteriaceae bacterium K1510]
MRFVWAVAAFVLAAILIGAGISQRTIFQGPPERTAQIQTSGSAPYTLIDGAVLTREPGVQRVALRGASALFVSYGRTADVKAWLSNVSYNDVTLDASGNTQTTVVAAAANAAQTVDPTDATNEQVATDAATPVPPTGSDLWLEEFSGSGALSSSLQVPQGMSVLVASDGKAAAPSTVTISWPLRASTPWAGPLIVLGGVFLLVGIVLYILAIRHSRRSRGPRRKAPPPLPVTEPIDLAIESPDRGVISSSPPSTRRSRGTRRLLALPIALVGVLAFAGCSADSWPVPDPSSSPSDSAAPTVPAGQPAPVVSSAQAQNIIARVRDTVGTADASLDANLAATRLAGAALAERQTNYTLRGKVSDMTALPAIPSGQVYPILPQAYDAWPRMVMAVVSDETDGKKTATIMMLQQQDPWSNYKLQYLGSLAGSTVLPDLAPDFVGATQIPPDFGLLSIAPDQLAAAYADLLTNGENSTSANLFDEQSDAFYASVQADRQKRLQEFNTTASTTGSFTFSAEAGSTTPLALATLESGAIVAVSVNEVDTVKPTGGDITIKFGDNKVVAALTGATESPTGVTSRYADQLFFYVPAQGSTDRIRLLGYSSNVLDAKVIQ